MSIPKKIPHKRGFSLIEMLITVGIFAIISSIIFVSGSSFDSNILLTNFAYDVALSTRQAQVYGLNVRKSTGAADFSAGYGITFKGTTPTQYEFFTDLNGNKTNDEGNELITTYQLNSGYTISNICGVATDGTKSCTNTGSIGGMTVTYTRPNPDATIRSLAGVSYSSIEVTLSGPRGNTRTVRINATGQISVGQ